MTSLDYELLDIGAGRRLERFGPHVLERPSPAAQGIARRAPEKSSLAAARYRLAEGGVGSWNAVHKLNAPWPISLGNLVLELKLTTAGQLGVFPEQADNWTWIASQVRLCQRPKVLNLFAYTGASTLVAAAAGAEVVHVDAAANVVDWARRNAAASNLESAPIRWIVEDAVKFVERELRRGNHYEAVLLDPPAYGHGPKGQPWKLEVDLPHLLGMCFELCRERGRFLLLSCHSGSLASPAELLAYAEEHRPPETGGYRATAVAMDLTSSAGARLNCGAAVRWRRSDSP